MPQKTRVQLQQELDDLKANIITVSERVAAENGWCEPGRTAVLHELGVLEGPRFREFTAEVTVKYLVTGRCHADGIEESGLNSSYIGMSLTGLSEIGLDSDFDPASDVVLIDKRVQKFKFKGANDERVLAG